MRREGEMGFGHHLQIYFSRVVECFSFESVVCPICSTTGGINSQSLLLPNWANESKCSLELHSVIVIFSFTHHQCDKERHNYLMQLLIWSNPAVTDVITILIIAFKINGKSTCLGSDMVQVPFFSPFIASVSLCFTLFSLGLYWRLLVMHSICGCLFNQLLNVMNWCNFPPPYALLKGLNSRHCAPWDVWGHAGVAYLRRLNLSLSLRFHYCHVPCKSALFTPFKAP